MNLEKAKQMIINWLSSTECVSDDWRAILKLCLELIDEKINANNNEE